MGFVKIQKTNAWYSRYQVKFRRRREGKTDYYQRKRLITQDQNKYGAAKYRFVVRFTNRDVVCQVVCAKLAGDHVLASAYAHELAQFGAKVVTTNYAAAYATALLCARRLLSKYGLAEKYEGNTGEIGEDYLVEELEGKKEPRPFYCLLDVGLRRTTIGARVFAALKGALDGGLEIPHSESNFAGFDSEAGTLDAATLRSHILGGHVASYMETLQDDADRFKKQFGRYQKAGIKAGDIEGMWLNVHKNIRANPVRKANEKKSFKGKRLSAGNPKRRTLSQRRDRVRQKIEAYRAKHANDAAPAAAAAESDEE